MILKHETLLNWELIRVWTMKDENQQFELRLDLYLML